MSVAEILAVGLGIISVLATAFATWISLFVYRAVSTSAAEIRKELGQVKDLVLGHMENKYATKEVVDIRLGNLDERLARVERAALPDRNQA